MRSLPRQNDKESETTSIKQKSHSPKGEKLFIGLTTKPGLPFGRPKNNTTILNASLNYLFSYVFGECIAFAFLGKKAIHH